MKETWVPMVVSQRLLNHCKSFSGAVSSDFRSLSPRGAMKMSQLPWYGRWTVGGMKDGRKHGYNHGIIPTEHLK